MSWKKGLYEISEASAERFSRVGQLGLSTEDQEDPERRLAGCGRQQRVNSPSEAALFTAGDPIDSAGNPR